jgi:ABC-type Fe3+ transport system substrate-binding protein
VNLRLLFGFGLAIAVVTRSLAAGPLRVITPHPEEVRVEFEEGFSRWHQQRFGEPVQIDWRDPGGSGEAQRFVENEFKAHPEGIGIDLFFGGGPEPFLAFSSRHWLDGSGIPVQATDGIPQRMAGADLYDPERTWFGACLATFGILQNRRVEAMAHLPRVDRWEDLARPELQGWVGAGDPRYSGTMNNMYEAVLQAYGWERGWRMLTAIAGNTRQFNRTSSQTAKDCALGQVAYAFCIDYYGFIQRDAAGSDGLEFVLPSDFTALSADGIAVLKGAPHRELASRFVTYVLSPEGQSLWYLPAGSDGGPKHHAIERLPVRPDVYERYQGRSRIQVNPFKLNPTFRYDAKLARNRRDAVRTLFGSLLVDLHPELRASWKAILARGARPEELAEFGSVPLRESEALEFAKKTGADPRARQRMKMDWQEWARTKYRRLAVASTPAVSTSPSIPTP